MGRRWLAGGALLLALGLLAAGCGGSSKSAATAPATTTTAATTSTAGPTTPQRSAALQAFQTCLKAHGVTTAALPFRRRPGNRPPATTNRAPGTRPRFTFRPVPAKERQAFQACRSKLPTGGAFFRVRPGRGRGSNPAFARYTACLAKHGVKFGAASPGSATFRKAQAACASLLPAHPKAPPPATTGGSTA